MSVSSLDWRTNPPATFHFLFLEGTLTSCGYAPLKGLEEARANLEGVIAVQEQALTPGKMQSKLDRAKSLLYQADVLVDLAREMLHAFPYREVPACWRELYSDAGILKALALGILASTGDLNDDSNEDKTSLLRQALMACDQVLVMAGASGPGRRSFVFELIVALENRIQGADTLSRLPPKRRRLSTQQYEEVVVVEEEEGETSSGQTPQIRFPISRVHLPTMDAFQSHVNGPLGGIPMIITGAIDHWPALQRWKDPKALCRIAGPDRLVPVEIGSQYTDEQWTQKLVTLKDFVDQFIVNKSSTKGPVGYLAQHDLFEQIPRLRRDIDIPDYCLVAPPQQDGYEPPEDVLLNAWFGPGGTVSPMHTDPYYNLLAQVVGQKYVRLYSPEETPKLYSFGASGKDSIGTGKDIAESGAGASTMLGNTSQVEVENPDLAQFPLFSSARYVEAVLEETELLYIPLQWWHYIRSLSTSFSVSFWF